MLFQFSYGPNYLLFISCNNLIPGSFLAAKYHGSIEKNKKEAVQHIYDKFTMWKKQEKSSNYEPLLYESSNHIQSII